MQTERRHEFSKFVIFIDRLKFNLFLNIQKNLCYNIEVKFSVFFIYLIYIYIYIWRKKKQEMW